jgi:hypothetical protein
MEDPISKVNQDQLKGGGNSTLLGPIPFSYLTASPLVLNALTAGQIIYRVTVIINVAFNDAAATMQLGTSTTPNLVFSSGDVNLIVIDQYDNEMFITIPSDDLFILTISPGTSTQGSGIIYYEIK